MQPGTLTAPGNISGIPDLGMELATPIASEPTSRSQQRLANRDAQNGNLRVI